MPLWTSTWSRNACTKFPWKLIDFNLYWHLSGRLCLSFTWTLTSTHQLRYAYAWDDVRDVRMHNFRHFTDWISLTREQLQHDDDCYGSCSQNSRLVTSTVQTALLLRFDVCLSHRSTKLIAIDSMFYYFIISSMTIFNYRTIIFSQVITSISNGSHGS